MKLPAPFITQTAERKVNGQTMRCSACFSHNKKYRYYLTRIWDAERPPLVVVGLNPSTATHVNNDPTILKLVKRAHHQRCGGLIIVNLFAFRATSPKDMLKHESPVGVLNDSFIKSAVNRPDIETVFCMWGTNGSHRNRGREVWELIEAAGKSSECVAVTSNGHPWHILYTKDYMPSFGLKLPSLKKGPHACF